MDFSFRKSESVYEMNRFWHPQVGKNSTETDQWQKKANYEERFGTDLVTPEQKICKN